MLKIRAFSELEILGAEKVLKKLFPRDTFYYCEDVLCSTLDTNGESLYSINETHYLKYVSILNNGVLIANYWDIEEEEIKFLIRDVSTATPNLIKYEN